MNDYPLTIAHSSDTFNTDYTLYIGYMYGNSNFKLKSKKGS